MLSYFNESSLEIKYIFSNLNLPFYDENDFFYDKEYFYGDQFIGYIRFYYEGPEISYDDKMEFLKYVSN